MQRPTPVPPRPRAAVFDLDGVLADVRHRLHLVAGRPRRWDDFFAAAPADPVLDEGRAAVLAAVAEGRKVVYLTGRPERCRADTLDWLARHGLPHGDLVMRPEGDRRPARATKLAALRRLAGRLDIGVVVDDDRAVVDALRAAGFPVLHADWMPRTTPSPSTTGSGLAGASPQEVLFEVQEAEGRT